MAARINASSGRVIRCHVKDVIVDLRQNWLIWELVFQGIECGKRIFSFHALHDNGVRLTSSGKKLSKHHCLKLRFGYIYLPGMTVVYFLFPAQNMEAAFLGTGSCYPKISHPPPSRTRVSCCY